MADREESRTDLGSIKIHENSIAAIAAIAATEIEGVQAIDRSLVSKVVDLVARKELSAIKVVFDKNNDVSLEIPLVVKYGYNIPDVSARVQENVRTSLEKMTTVSVKDIDITVRSIEKS